MHRLAQTRAPDTLARTLSRLAALEQVVTQLQQRHPELEARIQDLEAQVRARAAEPIDG